MSPRTLLRGRLFYSHPGALAKRDGIQRTLPRAHRTAPGLFFEGLFFCLFFFGYFYTNDDYFTYRIVGLSLWMSKRGKLILFSEQNDCQSSSILDVLKGLVIK